MTRKRVQGEVRQENDPNLDREAKQRSRKSRLAVGRRRRRRRRKKRILKREREEREEATSVLGAVSKQRGNRAEERKEAVK